MRHPNGWLHEGQPVPTYSTVLLAVSPHVLIVSVPPSTVASSSINLYTNRAPGENVLNPAVHEPDVYMPALASVVVVDSADTMPLLP